MDPQDNSFTSRKFIMCCAAGLIMVGLGLLAGSVMPGLAGVLTEVFGGILGCCGLFISGNVATRYFVSKANPATSFQGEIVQDSATDPKQAPKPPAAPAIAKKQLPPQTDEPEDKE